MKCFGEGSSQKFCLVYDYLIQASVGKEGGEGISLSSFAFAAAPAREACSCASMGRASSTGQEAGFAALHGPALSSSALVLFFPWFPCCAVVLHASYQSSLQTLKHGIHRCHQCILGPTPAGNCLPVSPMSWRH